MKTRVLLATVVGGMAMLAVVSMLAGEEVTQGQAARGLRGFVCSSEGKALSGARVSALGLGKAQTEEDGAFFIPAGQRMNAPRILVLAQGESDGKKLMCARFVDYATGAENVTLRLQRPAGIRGRVLSEDAQPISGVKVSPLMHNGGLTCAGVGAIGEPVETDEHGRFEIGDIYRDFRYMLRLAAPGKERKFTDWISVAVRQDVEIVLRDAPGFVAGRVVDCSGKPVPNTRVALGHPCFPQEVVTSDEEGCFRIDDLVPGEEVSVGIGFNMQKVKVSADDIVITLQSPGND